MDNLLLETLLNNAALVSDVRRKEEAGATLRVKHGLTVNNREWKDFRKEVFSRPNPKKESHRYAESVIEVAQVAEQAGKSFGALADKLIEAVEFGKPKPSLVTHDKKKGEVNWRELCAHADKTIAVKRAASWSQDEVTAEIKTDKPVLIVPISDWHAGSYGTPHSLLQEFTDTILSIPNAYVIIMGDMLQMAIKMRGVAEVADNVLHPSLQMDFLESWLDEIGHRVICSCWDNHSVMREENAVGFSNYAKIMGRRVTYFNGIGHVDLKVGQEVYKMALSHTFRGRSYLNPVLGASRYLRMEAQDREIALAGDSHTPGYAMYRESESVRLALNAGTLQLNSGYGKRYFSIKTKPDFPVFTLSPDVHRFNAFWSLGDYLETVK